MRLSPAVAATTGGHGDAGAGGTRTHTHTSPHDGWARKSRVARPSQRFRPRSVAPKHKFFREIPDDSNKFGSMFPFIGLNKMLSKDIRRLLLGGVDALDSHLVRVRVGLTVGARLRVKAGVTVGVRLRVRVRDGFRVAG